MEHLQHDVEEQDQDQEHGVYGGEIPDEGEMDADVEMSRPDDEDPNSKVLFLLVFIVYLCNSSFYFLCLLVCFRLSCYLTWLFLQFLEFERNFCFEFVSVNRIWRI